ncbi:MAG: TIGR02611 family protein [Pseudonocardiaceae bacterium]
MRDWASRRPGLDLAYRIVVGVVGTAVLATGALAIPYPGPGWLILFAGLAILGTEFTWAKRPLRWTRAHATTPGPGGCASSLPSSG